jgi:hypothetical protein
MSRSRKERGDFSWMDKKVENAVRAEEKKLETKST